MAKKGYLQILAIIGYGLAGVFVILGIAVAIFIGVNGFGKNEKKVNDLLISTPENTEEVITQNNVMSVYTKEKNTIVEFYIAGREGKDTENIDYSSVKVTLTINNSEANFLASKKDETSIWFVSRDENGEWKKDEEGNYVPIDTNTQTVQINQKVAIMLATTKYEDDELNPDKDALYIKGGISHIHARGGLLEADELKVQVDVPITNMKLVVMGYDYDGVWKDLTDSIENTQEIRYQDVDIIDNEIYIQKNLTIDDVNKTIYFTGTSSKYNTNSYYTVKEIEKDTFGWRENNNLHYFIKGSVLELGLRTFPANASQSIMGIKNPTYTLLSRTLATLDAGTNKLTITGDTNDNTGTIKVEASINELLNNTDIKLDPVSIIIQSAKKEIDKIEITNKAIINNDNKLNVLVGENINLFASSSVDDENHLGVTIIPKFYNGHDNPYSGDYNSLWAHILTNHSSDGSISGTVNVSSLNSEFINPLTNLESQNTEDENIVVEKEFSFKAKRLLLTDEKVYIAFSGSQGFDEDSPSYFLEINPIIVVPNRDEISFENVEDEVEGINLNITKLDKNYLSKTQNKSEDEVVEQITEEGYTTSNELDILCTNENKTLTYKKWVFFVDGDISEILSNQYISLTSTGQIYMERGTTQTFGSQVYGLSQGSVTIYPKLVLCDENNNPLNCFYETITVNENTGFILQSELDSTKLTEENRNKYVIVSAPEKGLKITVNEELADFAYFYDDFTQLDDIFEIKTGDSKTVYAIPNSINALNIAFPKLELTFDGDVNISSTSPSELKNALNQTIGIQFAVNPTSSGSFVTQIKNGDYDAGTAISCSAKYISLSDVNPISSLFEISDEIEKYLTADDDGRILYYTGDTIYAEDGETVLVQENSYLQVREQSGAYVYEAYTGNVWWSVENSDEKVLTLSQIVGDRKILFNFNNGTGQSDILSQKVYYNLNIKKAHGYENALKSLSTLESDVELIICDDKSDITKSSLQNLTRPSRILLDEITKDDRNDLQLLFYDGFLDELEGKKLFVVFEAKINNVVEGMDIYELRLGNKKLLKTIERPSDVSKLKFYIDGTTKSVSSEELETAFADIRDIIEVEVSSETTFSIETSSFELTLLKKEQSTGEYKDYSNILSFSVSSMGKIVYEAGSGYRIDSGQNTENPLSQVSELKLEIKLFNDDDKDLARFVVDYELKINFQVVVDS